MAGITKTNRLYFFVAIFVILPIQLKTLAQSYEQQVERAVGFIRDNRIEDAERELNLALKARPNEAVALNLLGTIRARQGRLDAAEDLFSRAIASAPRMAGAHLNLARLFIIKGEPEKAVLELKESLRLEANNAEARYRLAWTLFSIGRFDELIRFVETGRRSFPPSAPLLAVLGDAYLKKDSIDNAEVNYRSALEKDGSNADALLGLAMVARSRGDNKTATIRLNDIRNVIVDSPDLLYKFARIALDLQLTEGALQALKRAIELRPDDPSYYFLSGVALLEKPDLDEAESAFRRVLKLKPDHGESQLYLGYILLKQKNHTEARERLEKSIRKEDGAPDFLQYLGFYYLGLIAQEQNEDQKAEGLFEKAIGLAPSFAHARIALGSTYLKVKDYQRARQALEYGVKLKPDDSKAHYNLALLYSRLNEPERAQEEMQIVERLNKKGPATESDLLAPPATRPR